uniref:Carboxypeptidase regulatory-like domain-containing protein n=1 Tax=Eiseniibacteriota bacterium TaxID=2212470 RepID=A0A832HZL5_UNCEI
MTRSGGLAVVRRPALGLAACVLVVVVQGCAGVRPPSRAAERPWLVGSVLDAGTSKGLPHANVFVSELRLGTVCSRHGRFYLQLPDSGTFRVRALYPGCDPQARDVRVARGRSDTLVFRLTRRLQFDRLD